MLSSKVHYNFTVRQRIMYTIIIHKASPKNMLFADSTDCRNSQGGGNICFVSKCHKGFTGNVFMTFEKYLFKGLHLLNFF